MKGTYCVLLCEADSDILCEWPAKNLRHGYFVWILWQHLQSQFDHVGWMSPTSRCLCCGQLTNVMIFWSKLKKKILTCLALIVWNSFHESSWKSVFVEKFVTNYVRIERKSSDEMSSFIKGCYLDWDIHESYNLHLNVFIQERKNTTFCRNWW